MACPANSGIQLSASVVRTVYYYRDDIIHNSTVITRKTKTSLKIYIVALCLSVLCLSAWLLSACTLNFDQTSTLSQSAVGQLTSANDVMAGICFESAFDAAGRTFVFRDDAELTNLFDLSDNSHLCRHPVKRGTFDFSAGSVLAGVWSKGVGCKARHDQVKVKTNENKKQVRIVLDFVTEGDCNYELVRPYWVGISGAKDYTIKIKVRQP
jgi:hypothetical protein